MYVIYCNQNASEPKKVATGEKDEMFKLFSNLKLRFEKQKMTIKELSVTKFEVPSLSATYSIIAMKSK